MAIDVSHDVKNLVNEIHIRNIWSHPYTHSICLRLLQLSLQLFFQLVILNHMFEILSYLMMPHGNI